MFRIDTEYPFKGPHQNQKVVTAGEDLTQAKGAVIMIHGRGASAESILTLGDEFGDTGLHYAAPQASQFQWYPHSFLAPVEQNEPGLPSGLQAIFDVLTQIEKDGIPNEKIIILGFSQGACLACEFVARHPARYGGLVVLSGGLIGESVSADNYTGLLDNTPVFFGCSDIDPHIPLERVEQSAEIMEGLGGRVTKKIYPGMGHTVNNDEIEEIQKIINGLVNIS